MKKWHLIISFFVALALVGWVYTAATYRSPYFEVTMLDIGQGDSIFISDPTGYQMLIDGGPDGGNVVGKLAEVMPLLDTTIDTIMMSHPDADHSAGLYDVLGKYSVGTIIDNGVPTDTATADRVRIAEASESGAQVVSAWAGDSLQFPSGAVMRILHPSQQFQNPETNNNSIVARFQYGNVSFLFSGDADTIVENELMQTIPPNQLQSTVLKIPHHGSRFSSSLQFLKSVHPQFAIASYACKNDYGHPNPAAVARYQYLYIPVYTTCDRGTFTIQTDGVTAWVKE